MSLDHRALMLTAVRRWLIRDVAARQPTPLRRWRERRVRRIVR